MYTNITCNIIINYYKFSIPSKNLDFNSIMINLLFRRRISILIVVQVAIEMNTLKAFCLALNKVKHLLQHRMKSKY